MDDLPKLPSHYCRAWDKKKYFEYPFGTVKEVFYVYREKMGKEKADIVSYDFFRQLLKEKDIGIFKPKKDQCDRCIAFKLKNLAEEEYSEHILKKEEARIEKTVTRIKQN